VGTRGCVRNGHMQGGEDAGVRSGGGFRNNSLNIHIFLEIRRIFHIGQNLIWNLTSWNLMSKKEF